MYNIPNWTLLIQSNSKLTVFSWQSFHIYILHVNDMYHWPSSRDIYDMPWLECQLSLHFTSVQPLLKLLKFPSSPGTRMYKGELQIEWHITKKRSAQRGTSDFRWCLKRLQKNQRFRGMTAGSHILTWTRTLCQVLRGQQSNQRKLWLWLIGALTVFGTTKPNDTLSKNPHNSPSAEIWRIFTIVEKFPPQLFKFKTQNLGVASFASFSPTWRTLIEATEFIQFVWVFVELCIQLHTCLKLHHHPPSNLFFFLKAHYKLYI